MAVSVPWQLYLFCVLEFLGSLPALTVIPGFGGACARTYGIDECNSAEIVLHNYNVIWVTCVTVIATVLTYRNREDAPKLKRLAFCAIYIVIFNLAGIIMMGSQHLKGAFARPLHITNMVGSLVLIIILSTAVNSDSPLAGATHGETSLGFNTKGYLSLVALWVVVWVFANSDIQNVSDAIDPEMYTHLARSLWSWYSIGGLQVLFLLMFTIGYDNAGDLEAVSASLAGLLVFSMLAMYGLRDLSMPGITKTVYIQNTIFFVLAVAAVVRSKRDSRSDYESVPTASGVTA